MLKKMIIFLMLIVFAIGFISCDGDSSTESGGNGGGTVVDGQVLVKAGGYTYTTGGGAKGSVTVDLTHDFYIDKYEVTVKDFCDMLNYGIDQDVIEGDTSVTIYANQYVDYKNNGYKIAVFNGENSSGIVFNEQSNKFELTSSEVANLPMNNVNYGSAAFYSNMLSKQKELTELYTYDTGGIYGYDYGWFCNYYGKSGYRLPTKAEWVYAYKGGNKSQGYEFSGSDTYENVGWSWEYTAEPRHAIGQKSANELGLYDMTGNIAELNSDHFGYWTDNYYVDPTGGNGYDQENPNSIFLDGGLCNDNNEISSQTSGFSNREGFRVIKYIYSNPNYNKKPSCEIQDPAHDELFNQGDIIEASVKATDEDGTIAKVEFYLDNNLIGSNSETFQTYYYNYDISTTGYAEGSHTFKAIAIDNEGAKMIQERPIRLSNTVNASDPTAVFTISPQEGNIQTKFKFDATGSTDDIDDINSMQVRWDFDGDGNYDTNWKGAYSIEEHMYTTGDTCYVKMQIKDSGNRKATTTLQIKISDSVPPPPEVLVEGGTFSMGDHYSEGQDIELPLHDVTLDAFYIGKYEVTNLEYESITGSAGSGSDNMPIVYVSWYNATQYCNGLSELHGLTPCYSGVGSNNIVCDFSANGYRLPTEAEWEYAARGGVNHTDDYRYSGCHNESDLSNYAVYGGASTTDVGSKLPNQLGIYDMSGNVDEWCWDKYGAYSANAQTNPTGATTGTKHVVRGGYAYSSASRVRSSFRNASYNYSASRGFRIVRKK